ncbi:MAG: hypothetical protein NVSMB9_11370 [Isosphaeraceae bacterium]
MACDADAPRNLLFGLLALQTGGITQAQFVAAFDAWELEKTRPMPEVLAEQGAIDPARRAMVEKLLAEHLERLGDHKERSLATLNAGHSIRQGATVAWGPAVEATLAYDGPENGTLVDGDGACNANVAPGSPGAAGQRFRIVRPHAEGGLGAVFLAIDEELHREVALKQILEHHADDPASRERFIREAQVTGSLEHPGIVPVYGFGTDRDGRPYYAMRFISGLSLKEAIRRFHANVSMTWGPGGRCLALRKLLRRFLDVCNAIHYAHTRGVLHRDIKPANVIIGNHGETFMVDWGLAKSVDRSDPWSNPEERAPVPFLAKADSRTPPGRTLGTPAYMSPEQASRKSELFGPRSDVYSLGATLYCLLTGKPPFEDGELGAMLTAVGKGNFPKPRTLDPTIDPALEAVCLKAMALRPEDRYTTARALADDVERWMAGEPVRAWREPLSRHARRWARRNRTSVMSGLVALLAALLGTVTVLVVQTRSNMALKNSNAAMAAAKNREEARFSLAMEAIRTFHTGVSKDVLLRQQGFEDLRNRLLGNAVDFYGRLEGLLQGQTDPRSRQALGDAQYEVAELTAKIGSKPEALKGHQAALKVREALAEAPGADPALKHSVGNSLDAVGLLLSDTGQTAEALRSFQQALAIREMLAEAYPTVKEFQSALAATLNNLGALLSETNQTSEALALLNRALVIQEALARDHPNIPEIQSELARSHNVMGLLRFAIGQPIEALTAHRRAQAIQETLARSNPDVTDFQSALAASGNYIGVVLSATGRSVEGLASHKQALAIREALAQAHPNVTEFQIALAASHSDMGLLLSETGQPVEAMASLKRALAIQETLASAHPNVTYFRSELARSHKSMGLLLFATGKPEVALAAHRRSVAIQQTLIKAHPNVTVYQSPLAVSHNYIGVILFKTGQPDEALASFRRALAIQEALAGGHPSVTDYQVALAATLCDMGLLLSETGHPVEAMASLKRALKIQGRLTRIDPNVTDFQSELARSHYTMGLLLAAAGQGDEAMASYQQALAIRENLARASPSVTDYQHVLACTHMGIGRLLSARRQHAEALASYTKALAIQESLAERNSNMIEFQSDLALDLHDTGILLHKMGRSTEAFASHERALAIRDRLATDHPANPSYQSDLADSLGASAVLLMSLRRSVEAVAPARRALAIREGLRASSPVNLYSLACLHALLASLAGESESESDTELPEAQRRIGLDRAMKILHRAVGAGYHDVAQLRTDPALDALRSRADFRLLMMDLEFPPDPFRR